MSSLKSYFATTLGRKYFVGITGIFWAIFVMLHMLSNLLLFAGPETYNKYSYALISNPLIYIAETLLVIFILIHIIFAISLKLRNLRTKPIHYAIGPSKTKAASLSSRTMIYTGFAILGFLIWHIATFKYGPEYFVTYNGKQMRDLYQLVIGAFQVPFYVLLYCISVLLVGVHLFHGIQASFQTLGFAHPLYHKLIQYFGYLYAIVVAVGFCVQPIYVYFFIR